MDSDNAPASWRCTKCGEEKPLTLDYFYHSSKTKRGFQSWCKTCQKALNQSEAGKQYQKEYQQRPEAIERQRERNRNRVYVPQPTTEERKAKRREYLKRYRAAKGKTPRKPTTFDQKAYSVAYYQANRDIFRERGKEYREKNKEQLREKGRARYQANKEQWCQRSRNWQKANPDKKRVNKQRREARKRALPVSWTEQNWLTCLDYWHYCCAVCGDQLRDLFGEVMPHADHWIPLSYKGVDNPGTVPGNMICLCNSCNSSKHDESPADWLKWRYGTRKANEILSRIAAYFEYAKEQAGAS
jgi:hypothetical protein